MAAYDFEENLPPGVVSHDGEDKYLYRADQVLVSLDVVDAVGEALGDASYDESEEDLAQSVGVRRYTWRDGRDAREIRDAAEKASPGAVALNHVLVVQPRYYGHNAAPAEPADLPSILAEGTPGGGVAVGVLDTGYASRAPVSVTMDASDEEALDTRPMGELDAGAGHGTFVCGVVAGHFPNADLRAFKVLDSHGAGTDFDIALGLRRAAGSGCHILNLSLGGPTMAGAGAPVLARAIDELDPEIVVVAAAGNAGRSRPFFPGAFKRVICVGAVDADGNRPDWSNYGWWVDACAVGTDVHSLFPVFRETAGANPRDFSAGGARWLGTSFATPKVAAAIALVAERDGRSPREAARYLLHEAGLPVLSGRQLGTLIDPENLP